MNERARASLPAYLRTLELLFSLLLELKKDKKWRCCCTSQRDAKAWAKSRLASHGYTTLLCKATMIESIIDHFSDLGNGDSVLALMSSVPVPHAFALRACGERAAAFCRKDEGADPGAAGSSGGGGGGGFFKSIGSRRTPIVGLPSPAAATNGRTETTTTMAAATRQHDDNRAGNSVEERNSTPVIASKFTLGELEWPEVRAAKLLNEDLLSTWRLARREADSHLLSCWHGSFSCGADPFFTWCVR